MFKIAVIDDYQGVARSCADWDSLDGRQVDFLTSSGSGSDDGVERLATYDCIVAMRERTAFGRALLERLSNLRLLITSGSRNAAIDLKAAQDCGVTVCGTGGLGYPAAELAWGMMIAISRGFAQEEASLRAGTWQCGLGTGLHGKTLGILGLGNKGRAIAGYARAFGMDILAWSQNLTAERAAAEGATLVPMDKLLQRSDFVMIQLVLSDRTSGLIGARELSLMKPSAYLINTSRGPIVDEPALIDALNRNAIRGAALDVFEIEPLPAGHPFTTMPNVLALPHLGYVTDENYRIFYGDAVKAVTAFRNGQPLRELTETPTQPGGPGAP